MEDFNKSIELSPKEGLPYFHRAMLKRTLKDFRGAIADSNKTIEFQPENHEAYLIRGLIKLEINDKNGGCLDLSKAGELGNDRAYDIIKNIVIKTETT